MSNLPDGMSPAQARAIALYTALADVGDDDPRTTGIGARLTIRLADGTFIGDVLLTSGETDDLTGAAINLAAFRKTAGTVLPASADVLDDPYGDLPDVDPEDTDDIVAGFEALLGSEGEQQ